MSKTEQPSLLLCLAFLYIDLASQDGHVSDDEVRAIITSLRGWKPGLSEKQALATARKASGWRRTLQQEGAYQSTLNRICGLVAARLDAQAVLTELARLSGADGQFHLGELTYLRAIGRLLKVDAERVIEAAQKEWGKDAPLDTPRPPGRVASSVPPRQPNATMTPAQPTHGSYGRQPDTTHQSAKSVLGVKPRPLISPRMAAIFGALVLGIATLITLPIYLEYRLYREVVSSREPHFIDKYLATYGSDGRYGEEVRFTELDVAKNIHLARQFLEDFPFSRQRADTRELIDTLWRREIARYEAKVVDQGLDPASDEVQFFRALLTEMRVNDYGAISLNIGDTIRLKEFADYPNDIQAAIDAYFAEASGKPVTGNIIPMGPSFSTLNLTQFEGILQSGIRDSFNTVFTDNFIGIVDHSTSQNTLVIDIDYTIASEEDEGYPNIWTYETNGELSAYLVGITATFDFRFELPDDRRYTFTESVNPGESISNVGDTDTVYYAMTRRTFDRYATMISQRFGLITR